MEGGGKKTLWGREGWSERDRERDIPAELLCLPPVEKRTGFLDTCLCCLVLSSLAVCFFIWPLAVCSRSSPKPVRANYMKRPKRRGEKGAQIKAYFLRFLCDSSLTFLLLFCKEGEEKKKKDKTHQGTTWFSSFFTVFFFSFSFFFFFLHFPVDLNFSWADMLCGSPATPTVLNSSGSNTSRAQPINHRGAWQTNHLLMKRGSHEFLTAFVLFIKPDQTMKIQTSLKGNGGSRRE